MERSAIVACAAMALLAQATATRAQETEPIPAAEVALRQTAEAAVRDTLRDPDSARFKWPATSAFVVVQSWRMGGLLNGRTFRDVEIGCGQVNARNGFGGYTGFTAFRVVIKDGAAVDAVVDPDAGPNTRCF
jgi:hypothetical protein